MVNILGIIMRVGASIRNNPYSWHLNASKLSNLKLFAYFWDVRTVDWAVNVVLPVLAVRKRNTLHLGFVGDLYERLQVWFDFEKDRNRWAQKSSVNHSERCPLRFPTLHTAIKSLCPERSTAGIKKANHRESKYTEYVQHLPKFVH